jgi:hypothetical protein
MKKNIQNKLIALCLSPMLIIPSVAHAYGNLCVEDAYIVSINNNYPKGEVNSYRVGYSKKQTAYSKDDVKYIEANKSNHINFDHDAGRAVVALLTSAMAMKYKVSLYDDSGTACDDFNEVEVKTSI